MSGKENFFAYLLCRSRNIETTILLKLQLTATIPGNDSGHVTVFFKEIPIGKIKPANNLRKTFSPANSSIETVDFSE